MARLPGRKRRVERLDIQGDYPIKQTMAVLDGNRPGGVGGKEGEAPWGQIRWGRKILTISYGSSQPVVDAMPAIMPQTIELADMMMRPWAMDM